MSVQITTAFVEQYRDNLMSLVQQKGSRLRPHVEEEDVTGKTAFFEQVGAVEAQTVTNRHGDSPLNTTPHARRRVTLVTKELGDLVDRADKVRTLVEPTSKYALAQMWGMGRAMDDALITAATGSADTGVDGSTATTLPATQKVAVDYVESGSAANSGLTIGKLRKAKAILRANEVDPDEAMFFAVAWQQIQDLLATTQVGSADYNSIKALVDGEVSRFMGFDFVNTERLALNTSTDVRTCFCGVSSGLVLAIGDDPTVKISERADKRYSTYVYSAMDIGATRLEEEKIVQVLCDESP